MLGWSVLFLGKLDQEVNQYLVHILWLVADNNNREENDRRNYFMINFLESMGPGLDRTCDP